MPRILITWPGGEAHVSLRDTPCSSALMALLPLESSARTWGEEVYFPVPLHAELEADAEQVVPPGTVGFWTEGDCLAIPFGPTPISVGDECRLAARVNLLGRIEGDARVLADIKPGDSITVSACP